MTHKTLDQLKSAFSNLSFEGRVDLDSKITNIEQNSKNVKPGNLFFAMKGTTTDGHDFIEEAIKNGATGLFLEDKNRVPKNFNGWFVEINHSREFLGRLLKFFYDDPSRDLFCVGVTGTNGKTSTTLMVEHILNQNQINTGVIGTIDHHLKNFVWPTSLTTPGIVELTQRVNDFREHGAKALSMEVTSHAIDQNRIGTIDFDTVVFTNLTQDHLDYHKTMEGYFKAKEGLFNRVIESSSKPKKTAVVNWDDPYGRRIKVGQGVERLTYGLSETCHLQITNPIVTLDFLQFGIKFRGESQIFKIPITGQFNIYNLTAAIAVGLSRGLPLKNMAMSLAAFKGVKGRLEKVVTEPWSVFVDYAHTDDALRKTLSTLHALKFDKQKIITVFGCGGGRDKGKRPLMAQAASEFSDAIVVTSDNPRSEDPQGIIDDIMRGFDPKILGRVFSHVNRFEGIKIGLAMAQKGDIVLVAGKGHENYQILSTGRIDFDDAQVVLGLAKDLADGLAN